MGMFFLINLINSSKTSYNLYGRDYNPTIMSRAEHDFTYHHGKREHTYNDDEIVKGEKGEFVYRNFEVIDDEI